MRSNTITELDLYSLMDNFIGMPSDITKKLSIKKSNISKLFGSFNRAQTKELLITYKLIYDYNKLNPTIDYTLDNIEEILRKTCISVSRCNDKRLAQIYASILCVQTIKQIEDIKKFYRLIISTNENEILKNIRRSKKKLFVLWELLKEIYKEEKHSDFDSVDC
jgi:hypothetical protein